MASPGEAHVPCGHCTPGNGGRTEDRSQNAVHRWSFAYTRQTARKAQFPSPSSLRQPQKQSPKCYTVMNNYCPQSPLPSKIHCSYQFALLLSARASNYSQGASFK